MIFERLGFSAPDSFWGALEPSLLFRGIYEEVILLAIFQASYAVFVVESIIRGARICELKTTLFAGSG